VLLSVVVVVDFESRFCDLVVAGISGWWVCVGFISFRELMGGLITCIIVLYWIGWLLIEDARRVDVGCMSAAMMSVARAPEESKADDFNQAMSVSDVGRLVNTCIYSITWIRDRVSSSSTS
jgi:hypothetical protein